MDALRVVKFSELPNWSVQYTDVTDIGFTKKYPMVKIGMFLEAGRDVAEIQDDVEYKQITLKTNNGGVVPRNNGETILGSTIGTKRQKYIHSGQFIMSKIDARNGAYGIVPENLDGAIVTNDFPIFNVDEKQIIPQYLVLISTTKNFITFAQKCSSGTTNRKRIDIASFLLQQIPLPSKPQQEEIIARYNQTIFEATQKEISAAQLEDEIEKYLLDELGASVSKISSTNRINFVRFSETKRWDVQFFISSTKTKSKFEIRSLGSCLDCFMEDINGKSIRVETSKYPNDNFHYLGMENVEKNSGELIDLPIVNGGEIKSQTLRVPPSFLIYGKLRPYLNKYWLNNTQLTDVVCSSEFFVFHVIPSVNTLYFKYVLASSFVQQQLSDMSSGARMPRINEKVFKNIQIPIPPIEKQESIVTHIDELKSQIKLLKQQASDLRDQALKDFEKEIFE